MNWRLIIHVLGALCIIIGAAMLPSLGIALFGDEAQSTGPSTAIAFGFSAVFCAALGSLLRHLTRHSRNNRFTPSDGFAVAALGWVFMAALGALPLYLCGNSNPLTPGENTGKRGKSPGVSFTYIDAYFETMSGFTTTGASVFGTDRTVEDADGTELGRGLIEALPKSFLFWRSLTHWLGGMGIVVLCLAILPALRAGGYQMFVAEVPGPTAERLQPRIRETAAILWGVYLLLTIAETVLLSAGGMSLFDSLCHTFGTMATGGFSTWDKSVGNVNAVDTFTANQALYIEIVVDIFMFLAGCNFLLHFQALRGKLDTYHKNSEFRFYLFTVSSATLLIALVLARVAASGGDGSSIVAFAEALPNSLRRSAFQVISITTTTGFCTDNFDAWPGLCRGIMVMMMFIGGCAGSTGGGLKQIRILVALKFVYRELTRLLRPNLQNRIRIGDETVEERLVGSIVGLSILWIMIFVIATLLVTACVGGGSSFPGHKSSDDGVLVTASSAVAATLNNIGPGLSGVGATCNYGWMPSSAKIVLIICMLMGRLEIYSVVVLLVPLAWRK